MHTRFHSSTRGSSKNLWAAERALSGSYQPPRPSQSSRENGGQKSGQALQRRQHQQLRV